MDPGPLQPLLDDFAALPPDRYAEFAGHCRELAINRLDVRFMVLSECLRVSEGFWGIGDEGAVSSDFAASMREIWVAHLPGIISDESEAAAVQLALALKDELQGLGVLGPLDFRID